MNIFLTLFTLEWQSNWKKYIFFSICLALGVAGVSGVSSFGADVKQSLLQNARTLLGGDLEISAVKPLEEGVLTWAQNNKNVSNWTLVNRLTAMASLSNEQSKLVEVYAFSGFFPLVPGTLKISPQMSPQSLNAGEVMADGEFLDAWKLQLGDQLSVAGVKYTIKARIEEDLSREMGPFSFGPRVYLKRNDALEQGLLGKTSRFRESLFLDAPDAELVTKEFKTKFTGSTIEGVRIVSPTDESRSSNRLLQNLQVFLSQVALSALVLIGLGVSTSFAELIRQKVPDTGIYRALGAHPKLPSWIFLTVLVSICGIGGIGGVLLGETLRAFVFAPQLGGLFPVPLGGFSLSHVPVLLPLAAFVLPLCFLWPSLGGLERIPPSGVLRGFDGFKLETRWGDYVIWALGLATLLALFVTTSSNPWIGAGLFLVNLLLFLSFRLLLDLGLKFGQSEKFKVSTALEIAIAEISSRRLTSLLCMALIGIGLFVLSTVSFLKSDLLLSLQEDASQNAKPNLYFIDVQKSQQIPLGEYLSQKSDGEVEQAPMIRARLTHIDDVEVDSLQEDDLNKSQMRQREQNLSWKKTLGASEKVTSSLSELTPGELWASGPTDQVSLESRFAGRIGAKLGSLLRFSVSGVPVSARVTSLRAVNWQSLRPNFFVILHPSLIEEAPYQVLMSAFGSSPSKRAQIQSEVSQKFPNVSTIDGTRILERITQLSQGVFKVTQLLSTLLTGAAMLILAASLISTKQARRKNAAILRAMGASSGLIKKALITEFILMGATSAILGIGVAQIVAQILSRYSLDLDPSVDLVTAAMLLMGAIGLTLAIGYATCRSVLTTKPTQIFREI